MLHLAFLNIFWHPLGYCAGTHSQVDACHSYNFWSGIVGDVTIFTGFGAVLLAFWRTHNCHVHGCLRLMWHPHPESGHPVCKHHHPHTVYADRVVLSAPPSGAAASGAAGGASAGPGQPPGGG
jgi:hypothetical protein